MSRKKFGQIFSYWISLWFIFYYFNIIRYNPLPLLILSIIASLYMQIKYIYDKNYYKALIVLLVNFFIKIIPVYLIRKDKITKEDIYFSIIYFEIFLVYSYFTYNYNIIDIITNNSETKNKNLDLPVSNFLNNIIK